MKLVLITTYFGKFPSNFGIWLKSAEKNKNIDFLVFSDCSREEFEPFPKNVKIIKKTFTDIQKDFQSFFDFKITLNTPYKLCDYKPAYGLVFQKYIKNYDYWGHIDIDTVLGDLESFLPKKDYEKIYRFGHLCIYKNTDENNKRFTKDGGMNYKDVFTTANIAVFDEVLGMEKKFKILNVPTYISRDFADITKRRYRFTLTDAFITKQDLLTNNYDYQVFYYENGRVYRDFIINNEIKTQEFNYIHFSSRKMVDHTNGSENFYITNKGFFPKNEKVTKEIIEKYNPKTPIKDKATYIKCRINDAKRKIKKIIQKRKEQK